MKQRAAKPFFPFCVDCESLIRYFDQRSQIRFGDCGSYLAFGVFVAYYAVQSETLGSYGNHWCWVRSCYGGYSAFSESGGLGGGEGVLCGLEGGGEDVEDLGGRGISEG